MRLYSTCLLYCCFTMVLVSLPLFPAGMARTIFIGDTPAPSSPALNLPLTIGADPLGGASSLTIPLKRVGRLLLIEATVDDETGNFVFDSGTSRFVLNRTYFRKYAVREPDIAGGVTGTTSVIGHIKVKKVFAGGLSYQDVSAEVTSLGHIENRRGVKILGLFGFGMLKNLEVVIDAANSRLTLYRLDRSGNRVSTVKPAKSDLICPFVCHRDVLFVEAAMGGKHLNFCLDTGAERNVLNSFTAKKALSTVVIERRSDLVGVGDGSAEVLYGTLTDFTLGGRKIPGMQTIITSLNKMSEAYGMPIDGMLGYDFFSQGEISVNMVREEIGIRFKNKETP